MCPQDPIRSHLCDRGIPTEARGPKRKVGRAPCRACCLPQSIEPGQVHTPQELFCRALLGQRARGRLHHAGYSACPGSLRDPISKWSGLLARCLSEAGRVRTARGRPSVLAERRRHRCSAAAMACGWRGLQFAGAQDSIAYLYLKLNRRGRPRTRVQAGMLSNVYGMLDCVAQVCDRN